MSRITDLRVKYAPYLDYKIMMEEQMKVGQYRLYRYKSILVLLDADRTDGVLGLGLPTSFLKDISVVPTFYSQKTSMMHVSISLLLPYSPPFLNLMGLLFRSTIWMSLMGYMNLLIAFFLIARLMAMVAPSLQDSLQSHSFYHRSFGNLHCWVLETSL